ncbi:hypothetical protein EGN72_02590 [Pseudorhodobacter sp. E13]|uniref:hypothetical protein n=1 Tax=Pseudorhodobacter sp. E13 TaxID=2487931 RepID=UPI000F8D3676|nr:hypothetical protein [Pseudorhodobacter sp. E13]RUS64899.1 hypothetical protein EGN72_02590 [Pseudorhodobacter sp. E13]
MNALVSPTPVIEPRKIIEAYAALRRIDISRVVDLNNRCGAIVWPRHELSWLLSTLGGLSYAEIGACTGDRDPTSVMNSLNRINQRCETDQGYAKSLEVLTAQMLEHSVLAGRAERQGAALARRLMRDPDANRADIEALAICVLTAASVLGAETLSDTEARRAVRGLLCDDGGRTNG